MSGATATYELLLRGNNLSFRGGFFGFCNVALVTAAGGQKVLFDTGHYCVRKGLLAALTERGLRPGDIDTVFLSHLHFDHCQNLDLFAHATVCVGQTELQYAQQPHEDDLFVPWKIHALLEGMTVRALPPRGEVLPGIEHFEVPGHTPGCQAIRFAQPDARRVVLAGDAIKYAKEILAGVGDACFGSQDDSRRSIATIAEGADVIVPGHFPALFRRGGGWIWEEAAELPLLVR